MRYLVRNDRGEELVCPSLADLHALYRQGFLADDDRVRQESGDRWERLGDFAPFRGERERRTAPRRGLLLAAVATAAAVLLWRILAGR